MRRGRKRRGSTDPVPAVLPQIIAEVVSDEYVVLSVGGQRLPGAPTTRGELGRVIGELVAGLGGPTRVEVHERDGSVWADIITPATPPPSSPTGPPVPVPTWVELTADGFIPGEEVTIALVLRHGSASGAGTARVVLDRAEQAGVGGEVILLGRISGTFSVQRID